MRFIMMKSVYVLAHKNFFTMFRTTGHIFGESLTMECVDNNNASMFEKDFRLW